MTKSFTLFAPALVAILLLASCKNSAPTDPKKANITYPYEKPDSIVGFKGCQMAGFSSKSAENREFRYQDYVFVVTDRKDEPGEKIGIVFNSDTTRRLEIPATEEAYFMGVANNHFFMDRGTGPDVRELVFYRFQAGEVYLVYRTNYYPEPAPFVSTNGALWYYAPIEEKDMIKIPDCPDREKWLKEGLRVGYGQRVLYNLNERMLTRKSEYVCVPLQ
ncbi:MAG: hypothetical protein ABMA02_10220 [Saprospiraceae bacterium]